MSESKFQRSPMNPNNKALPSLAMPQISLQFQGATAEGPFRSFADENSKQQQQRPTNIRIRRYSREQLVDIRNSQQQQNEQNHRLSFGSFDDSDSAIMAGASSSTLASKIPVPIRRANLSLSTSSSTGEDAVDGANNNNSPPSGSLSPATKYSRTELLFIRHNSQEQQHQLDLTGNRSSAKTNEDLLHSITQGENEKNGVGILGVIPPEIRRSL